MPVKEYLGELVSLTGWVLSRARVTRKELQVLAGRWIRAMSLRRQCFAVFCDLWHRSAHGSRCCPVPAGIVDELLMAVCQAPLMYCDLRAHPGGLVTASDASEEGAGACASSRLSARGEELARQVGRAPVNAAEEEAIIVSVFDGIAGARVAWNLLGLPPRSSSLSRSTSWRSA